MTWFRGQSQEGKKGSIGEILVYKTLVDDLNLDEGKDFYFHTPYFLYHEPDFSFVDGDKIVSTLSITHRTASSQSQNDFWENVEELFEDKVVLGNNCICGMLTLGLMKGWKNWLIDGFRVIYDAFDMPEEKLGHRESVLQSIYNKTKGKQAFDQVLDFIRQNENKGTINDLLREISKFAQNLLDNTEAKERYSPLWNNERKLFQKCSSQKRNITKKYSEFPDFNDCILTIAKLDESEIGLLRKILKGEAEEVEKEELKKLGSLGIISKSVTGNPLFKDYILGSSDERLVKHILVTINREMPIFQKMVEEIRNSKVLLKRIDIIFKATDYLSSSEKITKILYETCMKNFEFQGIKEDRNWVLVVLMEVAGLKINQLINEANAIYLDKGKKKRFSYSIYYDKLSKKDCEIITQVLQKHLPTKIAKLKDRLAKNLVERRLQSVKRDRRLTPLRYALSYQLMKSKIPKKTILGYPTKKYIFPQTFFCDLLDLGGLAGKIGRSFEISSKDKKYIIHVQNTSPGGLQHRCAEHAGKTRGIRYRYLNGKWIDLSESDDKVLIPIMVLGGAWKGKNVFRLFTAGVKYVFRPSLQPKWDIISFLEKNLS